LVSIKELFYDARPTKSQDLPVWLFVSSQKHIFVREPDCGIVK